MTHTSLLEPRRRFRMPVANGEASRTSNWNGSPASIVTCISKLECDPDPYPTFETVRKLDKALRLRHVRVRAVRGRGDVLPGACVCVM